MNTIRPAPQNSLIYKPISYTDVDIEMLARSIKEQGRLLEPIVVTQDGYILSGHRRYAACQRLGMSEISCRVAEITLDDPKFEVLLREFNRQRVKSFDEVVRECVIDANSGDAYEALISQRKAKARVSGDLLTIEGIKTRKTISLGKMPMLRAAIAIIRAQREYWPLSDRSIHYDLLNDPPLRHAGKPDSWYANNRDSYKDLCDLLTRARLAGDIPFDAIADPTRTIVTWDVYRDLGAFVADQLDGFLKHSFRGLQQSQPNHIEIVGEKNTIEGSIRHVAMEYCVPYTLGRGYCSLDPRYKMSRRFKASGKEKLIVLILSDFDPEGEDIAHSFIRSMRDDFSIRVEAKKVCLTYKQVLERDFPQTFDIKKSSPRYRKFAAKYGDRAHELEALSNAERARLLEEAIRQVMDVDAYNREVDQERKDAEHLAALREKVGTALTDALRAPDEK
jgi:hypothetical protein